MNPHVKIFLSIVRACLAALLVSTSLCVVNGTPVITRQPQHQNVLWGGTATFRVSASDTQTLTYQWRLQGVNLPGKTNASLVFTNAKNLARGPYSVVVGAGRDSATSIDALLTIYDGGGPAGFIRCDAPPGDSLMAVGLFQFPNNGAAAFFPVVPEGASIFKPDGNGYVANNYLGGWSNPEMTFMPGEGFFIRNPTVSTFVNYHVGAAQLGRLTNFLGAGHSLCSPIAPQWGALSTLLEYFPPTGTVVYLFDNTNGYTRFTRLTNGWDPAEPVIQVLRSFRVRQPSAKDWGRGVALNEWNYAESILHPQLVSETPEVNFMTYNSISNSGRVFDTDGVTPVTNAFYGQLYAGSNPSGDSLLPIGNPAAFRDGVGAGYIRDETVRLEGFTGAQQVYLQLRVWEKALGNTYETARAVGSKWGASQVFSVTAHATVELDEPGLPPPNANGFPSFSLQPGVDGDLKIVEIQPIGPDVRLRFTTRAGYQYRAQSTDALSTSISWQTIAGAEMVPGTGAVVEVIHAGGAALPQCFYRVYRLP